MATHCNTVFAVVRMIHCAGRYQRDFIILVQCLGQMPCTIRTDAHTKMWHASYGDVIKGQGTNPSLGMLPGTVSIDTLGIENFTMLVKNVSLLSALQFLPAALA